MTSTREVTKKVDEVTIPETHSGFPKVSKKTNFFLDSVASERPKWREKYAYYHSLLSKQIRFLVEPNSRILDIGCDTGELLASLKPARGIGLDFSPTLVKIARERFSNLDILNQNPNAIDLNETVDYILLNNSLGYLDNIQNTFTSLQRMCSSQTRVIVACYNQFWRPILEFAEWCGLRMKWPEQNWLCAEDESFRETT